jgi:hypothetical protein
LPDDLSALLKNRNDSIETVRKLVELVVEHQSQMAQRILEQNRELVQTLQHRDLDTHVLPLITETNNLALGAQVFGSSPVLARLGQIQALHQNQAQALVDRYQSCVQRAQSIEDELGKVKCRIQERIDGGTSSKTAVSSSRTASSPNAAGSHVARVTAFFERRTKKKRRADRTKLEIRRDQVLSCLEEIQGYKQQVSNANTKLRLLRKECRQEIGPSSQRLEQQRVHDLSQTLQDYGTRIQQLASAMDSYGARLQTLGHSMGSSKRSDSSTIWTRFDHPQLLHQDYVSSLPFAIEASLQKEADQLEAQLVPIPTSPTSNSSNPNSLGPTSLTLAKMVAADRAATGNYALMVPRCLSWILDGLNSRQAHRQEHILRIAASSQTVELLFTRIATLGVSERTRSLLEDPACTAHVLASLLKRVLRALDEGLVPESLYDRLCQQTEEEQDLICFLSLNLSTAHWNTLHRICTFLVAVVKHESQTHLDLQAVAKLMAPLLLRRRLSTLRSPLLSLQREAKVLALLLDQFRNSQMASGSCSWDGQ